MSSSTAFITSTNSKRQSNIELFRILATIGVLVIHTSFFIFDYPSNESCVNNPSFCISLYFWGSLSIGSVNMFVLISGWFGINPNIKSLVKLIFQCFFILLFGYFALILTNHATLSLNGIRECLLLGHSFWFIKSYLLLYLLSPILNNYISSISAKEYRIILACFFSFQTIFGWLLSATDDFDGGYSTISMIGLYLLARYIKLYPCKLTTRTKLNDIIVLVVVFASILMLDWASSFVWFPSIGYINSYINPLIIIFCLYALLLCSKIKIESNLVNWIARSSFSVYLLQGVLISIVPLWTSIIIGILELSDRFTPFFALSTFVLIFFVGAILIDQLRILAYTLFIKLVVK